MVCIYICIRYKCSVVDVRRDNDINEVLDYLYLHANRPQIKVKTLDMHIRPAFLFHVLKVLLIVSVFA